MGWREENTIVKEREIDLRDLLAELLSHWRVLLICMLAGAVLAGGYGLMRALKEQAVQTEASVNAEEAAETQEIGETADAPGRGISDGIRLAVFGAAAFAFVYAGLFSVRYMINDKLRAVDGLQELFQISQLGLIVKEEEKERFFIDRWIDVLRSKSMRRITREQSLELAATAVRILIYSQGIANVCFMGCDLKAGADSVIQALKKQLDKEKTQITVLDNVLYEPGMMEELKNVKNVVLIEKAMSTRYDEIIRELELISRQGLTVLGGIIVE